MAPAGRDPLDELLGELALAVVETEMEGARHRWPPGLSAMPDERRRALVRDTLEDQTLPRAVARAVILAYVRHKRDTGPDDMDDRVLRAWGSH